jgi:hypothetical protein
MRIRKEDASPCKSRRHTANDRLLLRQLKLSSRKAMRMTISPHRRGRGLIVKDPTSKLCIVKTLRLSEALLQKIRGECAACNLGFSDFMRNAAVAAVNRKEASQ